LGWTQTQLSAIEDAIATGSLLVRYGDKMVQYRNMDDMLRIRELMRRELGVTEASKQILPEFSKGTD